MLEVLFQALPQRVGDLVEADELLDTQHLRVVARCAGVQTLDDGRHVAKDAGVHEGWSEAAGVQGVNSSTSPPGHRTPGPDPHLLLPRSPLIGGPSV